MAPRQTKVCKDNCKDKSKMDKPVKKDPQETWKDITRKKVVHEEQK